MIVPTGPNVALCACHHIAHVSMYTDIPPIYRDDACNQ